MTYATPVADTQERYLSAIKALRKQGIKFRQNVSKCCRGCILPEDIGLNADSIETQPYGYTYGGQGQAIGWVNGTPVNRADQAKINRRWGWQYNSEVAEKSVYINWGNDAGRAIAAAFRDQGFDVEWDGSDHSCVVVNFPTV